MAKGSSPFSRIETNGIMHSGTVACNSSVADLGLVMSAITKQNIPASNLTVSVKPIVSGLSKLKTIGRKFRSRSSFRSRSFGPL
jgi:hypothetical protein